MTREWGCASLRTVRELRWWVGQAPGGGAGGGIGMKVKGYPHVVVDAGICGGEPRVAGTRITVAHIAEAVEHLGMTPDDLVAIYPSLDLAKVHAALAYYHDHRKAIEASLRRARHVEARLRRRFPPRARQVFLSRLG